jgi:hypothetical protein
LISNRSETRTAHTADRLGSIIINIDIMKLKSLFEVIFKVLGIYMIIRAISFLPQLFASTSLFYFSDSLLKFIITIISVIASIFILLLIGWFLITRSELLTNRIVPEERLNEDFTTFKVHRSVVLTISIIVLGGLIIVQELPRLFMYFFQVYSKRQIGSNVEPITFDYIVYTIVKLLIGLYLVFYCKTIVNWIDKKRR